MPYIRLFDFVVVTTICATVYKMITNLVYVDVHTFFTMSDFRPTRNDGVKLKSQTCSNGDVNFSERVVSIWNALRSHIVQSPSVATFKRRLGTFDLNFISF